MQSWEEMRFDERDKMLKFWDEIPRFEMSSMLVFFFLLVPMIENVKLSDVRSLRSPVFFTLKLDYCQIE